MQSESSQRTNSSDPLLTALEAAKLLNVAVITLSVWRNSKCYGPSYVKLGSSVRYPLSEVNKFISGNTINFSEKKND